MKIVTSLSFAAAALISLACTRSSALETSRGEASPMADASLDSADHAVRFEQKSGCVMGAVCTATIRLETKSGMHVNEGFPYKFKGMESGGVELLGSDPAKKNDFSKAAGDLTLESKTVAVLAVRFKLAAKQGTVAGTYKYAICNEANCFPKELALSLAATAR